MALPGNPTFNTWRLTAFSSSVGGTPVTAYVAVPYRSRLLKVTGILRGAITSADATITVNVNGTSVGTFTVTQSGSAAGQFFSLVPGSPVYLNEDDVISIVPSGASGSSIGMDFSVSGREA